MRDTLLLPLKSSCAIHGKVPRTSPDTKVFCFTLGNPKSPIWKDTDFLEIYKLVRRYMGDDQMIKKTSLAHRKLRISYVHKNILTFQIKMNYVLSK